MHWQSSPYTLPLLLSAALATGLALYAWLRRATPGARFFTFMIVALAEWSSTAALGHASADLASHIVFNNLQYLGIVATVAAWLCVCLEYTGHRRWLERRHLALLAVMPVLTMIAVWTNGYHHLFWTRIEADVSGGLLDVETTFGPLFWIHTAYSYLLLVAGSTVLLTGLLRAPQVYRAQAWTLLAALVVPWIVNIAYVFGYRPYPHLDLTPFAFTLSSLFFGYGLFRYGLLDLVPVARDAVIEAMSDGVIVLDDRLRIVDMNPVARSLAGAAAHTAIGRPASEVLAGWADFAGSLAAGAAPSGGEVTLGDPPRTHEVVVSALSERPGSHRGWLVVLRDVTERRAAEHALRRQNEYLAALLESSRVINSGLDLPTVLQNIVTESAGLVQGLPGGVGLVVNGAVVFDHLWIEGRWEKTHFALPLGEGVAGIVAQTGRARIVNDVRADPAVIRPEELLKYGVVGMINVPIVDRAGCVVGVLDVRRRPGGPPFGDGERLVTESLARQAAIAIENAALYGALEEKKARIAESLHEIEELYAHEQQMTRRLQELNLMKTNFMIVTSHEMRTPLTLLRGYLEALLDGYLGAPSPAQERALALCGRTVDRMIASFNDILAMLQLGQRRVALDPQPMDLRGLAEQVLEELRPFVERRRLEVSLRCPDTLPTVVADPGKVRLVLQNLLENAIKFTPDAGAIGIAIDTDGRQVHLAVEDSGIGIEAAELEKIFDEFYTSPDSLHHHSGTYQFQARGAGLGLAIAKGFVEAHGGRLWAESGGRGKGSRFHVVLPCPDAVGTLAS